MPVFMALNDVDDCWLEVFGASWMAGVSLIDFAPARRSLRPLQRVEKEFFRVVPDGIASLLVGTLVF